MPLPERFAIHKLVGRRLRAVRTANTQKDIDQAIVRLAVLATTHSGAIESALLPLPKGP